MKTFALLFTLGAVLAHASTPVAAEDSDRRLFMNNPASSTSASQCVGDCHGNCFFHGPGFEDSRSCEAACEREHKCHSKPRALEAAAETAIGEPTKEQRRLLLNNPAGSYWKEQCAQDCNVNCLGDAKCRGKCEREHKCASKPKCGGFVVAEWERFLPWAGTTWADFEVKNGKNGSVNGGAICWVQKASRGGRALRGSRA